MDHETHVRERQAFSNISSQTWMHPADQAALAALQGIPGLDMLLQKFIGATSDTWFRSVYLASAVRVSQRQFPQMYALLQEACRILDAPYLPELYVAHEPFFNAGTMGVEQPFIVLHAAVLDTLTDDEILFVIGHELGHCLSGLAPYKTLLQLLLKLSPAALQVPLGGAALMGLIAALMEWHRKCELSADRAGLLVVQDPAISYSLLMKMAGGSQANRMDVNELFVQAAEYERRGNRLTSMHPLLNPVFASHPFPVVRLTELQAWVNSGAYSSILSQNYRVRSDETKPQDDLFAHLKAASENYQARFNSSKDVLTDIMSDVFTGLGTWSGQARHGMDTLFDLAAKFDPAQTSSATMPTPPSDATVDTSASTSQTPSSTPEQEIFSALEKLGDLKHKEVLTDEEFEAQKAKLLNRL